MGLIDDVVRDSQERLKRGGYSDRLKSAVATQDAEAASGYDPAQQEASVNKLLLDASTLQQMSGLPGAGEVRRVSPTPPPEVTVEERDTAARNLEERNPLLRGLVSGIDQTQALLHGAVGLAGSAVGVDSVRDWGYEGMLRNEREAALNPQSKSFKETDFGDLGEATEWFAYTIGNLAPSAAEVALSSLIGASIGAAAGGGTPASVPGAVAGAAGGAVAKGALKTTIKTLLKKKVEEEVKKGAYTKILATAGKEAAERAATKAVTRRMGSKIGTVAGTAALESGGMWGQDAKTRGVEEANPYSALALGTVSGALELFSPSGRLISKIAGGEPKRILTKEAYDQTIKGMHNFLKRAGKDIPITMLEEGSQEAMQEFIAVVNEKINDPDVDKAWKDRAMELFSPENLSRYEESAAAGAAGGVIFGTGKAAMPDAKVQKEGDLDGILRLPAPGDQGGGAAPAPPGAPLTFGGGPAPGGPTDAEAFGANPVIVDELVKSVDSGMFTLPELDEIRNNPEFMAQHRLTPADIDEATRIIGAREQEEADDAVINRAISGQTTEEAPAPAANLITPELDDASAVNIFKGKYTGTVDFQPGDGKSGTFRVARAIGSIFGKRVVPVKMGEGYNGAFDPENPGVVFVNEDSPVSAAFIMGHELNHGLEVDDAESWNVLMSVAKEEMTPEQFTSYKDRLGKKITENGEQVDVSDDDVYREMLADFSGNNFTKQEFWDKVFAKDKNAFEKIVDRMQFIISKVKESLAWEGAESQKFFKDVQKMEDALAEAVRKHIGPMEASKAASTMKGVVGTTVGEKGATTTSIKIGEGSTMNLTEDDKTVTIESMGRPGAKIEGIREETSDKDKGEPTKVLTKVMDTAKGKGKKVIARGAAENPYFLKQGFMPLPNGDAVFYPDQTPGKKAKAPKLAKATAPAAAAPEKAQEVVSVASEAAPGTEAPAVSEEPTGGTTEVPAEPEADTLPHRLARAVGKPEQVDLLVKGGHTTEDAQITEIIRDAIINPSIAVNGLKNRLANGKAKDPEKTQAMIDTKEAEIKEAAEKLKAVDGKAVDNAVDLAMEGLTVEEVAAELAEDGEIDLVEPAKQVTKAKAKAQEKKVGYTSEDKDEMDVEAELRAELALAEMIDEDEGIDVDAYLNTPISRDTVAKVREIAAGKKVNVKGLGKEEKKSLVNQFLNFRKASEDITGKSRSELDDLIAAQQADMEADMGEFSDELDEDDFGFDPEKPLKFSRTMDVARANEIKAEFEALQTRYEETKKLWNKGKVTHKDMNKLQAEYDFKRREYERAMRSAGLQFSRNVEAPPKLNSGQVDIYSSAIVLLQDKKPTEPAKKEEKSIIQFSRSNVMRQDWAKGNKVAEAFLNAFYNPSVKDEITAYRRAYDIFEGMADNPEEVIPMVDENKINLDEIFNPEEEGIEADRMRRMIEDLGKEEVTRQIAVGHSQHRVEEFSGSVHYFRSNVVGDRTFFLNHGLTYLALQNDDAALYNVMEAALALNALAKTTATVKDGEVRTLSIGDNNLNMPLQASEIGNYLVEEIRAGKGGKKAVSAAYRRFVEDKNKVADPGRNGWVKFNQGDDAKKLYEACMGSGWCTGQSLSTAQMQLNGGDFHVYFEKGKPHVAIRTNNGTIAEPPRGLLSGQALEPEYEQVAEDRLTSGEVAGGEDFLNDRRIMQSLKKWQETGEVDRYIMARAQVNDKYVTIDNARLARTYDMDQNRLFEPNDYPGLIDDVAKALEKALNGEGVFYASLDIRGDTITGVHYDFKVPEVIKVTEIAKEALITVGGAEGYYHFPNLKVVNGMFGVKSGSTAPNIEMTGPGSHLTYSGGDLQKLTHIGGKVMMYGVKLPSLTTLGAGGYTSIFSDCSLPALEKAESDIQFNGKVDAPLLREAKNIEFGTGHGREISFPSLESVNQIEALDANKISLPRLILADKLHFDDVASVEIGTEADVPPNITKLSIVTSNVVVKEGATVQNLTVNFGRREKADSPASISGVAEVGGLRVNNYINEMHAIEGLKVITGPAVIDGHVSFPDLETIGNSETFEFLSGTSRWDNGVVLAPKLKTMIGDFVVDNLVAPSLEEVKGDLEVTFSEKWQSSKQYDYVNLMAMGREGYTFPKLKSVSNKFKIWVHDFEVKFPALTSVRYLRMDKASSYGNKRMMLTTPMSIDGEISTPNLTEVEDITLGEFTNYLNPQMSSVLSLSLRQYSKIAGGNLKSTGAIIANNHAQVNNLEKVEIGGTIEPNVYLPQLASIPGSDALRIHKDAIAPKVGFPRDTISSYPGTKFSRNLEHEAHFADQERVFFGEEVHDPAADSVALDEVMEQLRSLDDTAVDFEGLPKALVYYGIDPTKEVLDDKKLRKYQFKPVDVNTKEFKKFFGKSRVTKNGKVGGPPMKVIHSSKVDLSKNRDPLNPTFDRSLAGTATEKPRPAAGLGIFFQPGLKTSDLYGTHKFYTYIRMERPYVLPLAKAKSFKTMAQSRDFSAKLEALGFDGIYIPEVKYFAVFDSSQVTSAEENTGKHSGTGNIYFSRNLTPLVEAIDKFHFPKKAEGISYKGLLRQLADKGKISVEELEFSGLPEFLAERDKDTITKEELIRAVRTLSYEVEQNEGQSYSDGAYENAYDAMGDHYDYNERQIIRDNIGDLGADLSDEDSFYKIEKVFDKATGHILREYLNVDDDDQSTDEALWSFFRAGKSLEQIVNAMVSTRAWQDSNERSDFFAEVTEGWDPEDFMGDVGQMGGQYSDMVLNDVEYSEYEEQLIRWHPHDPSAGVDESKVYQGTGSAHWGTHNVLAHWRSVVYPEAVGEDGTKGLAYSLLEVQSDWHSDAVKAGGYGPITKWQVKRKSDGYVFNFKYDSKEEALNDGIYAGGEIEAEEVSVGVPDAPFKKSWPLLVFKEALKKAVSAGATFVTWPSTAAQIEEIEGGEPSPAVLRHYTSQMPKMVGNFVKNYGAKVEKVAVGETKPRWVIQNKNTSTIYETVTAYDNTFGTEEEADEYISKKKLDKNVFVPGYFPAKGYEFFGVRITPQLKSAVDKNQIPQFSRNLDKRSDPVANVRPLKSGEKSLKDYNEEHHFFHVTTQSAAAEILKSGFNKTRPSEKWGGTESGDGMYVWNDADNYRLTTFAFDDAEMDPYDLAVVVIHSGGEKDKYEYFDAVIDEDTLSRIGEEELDDDFLRFYESEFDLEKEWDLWPDKSQGGKVKFIDKFNIKPQGDLADYGQGGRGWPMRLRKQILSSDIAAVFVYDEDGSEDFTDVMEFGPPQFSRNLDPRDPHPEVERRMKEAQGTTDHPWQRRWQTFKNIVVSFRTPLVSLYGTEGHGQLKDILRVLKSAGQFGASQAYKEIYSTIAGLNEAEYKVFSSNLILADLLKDTVPNEKGETVLTPETGYPFGFTSQREIMESYDHFKAQARLSPKVMEALTKRRQYMEQLQNDLVARKILPESILKNRDYFHHQVLEHMNLEDPRNKGVHVSGIGIPRFGWRRMRSGSMLDFNTDYIQSEFLVLSQAVSSLEMAKAKSKIRSIYDMTAEIKAQAKVEGIDDWKTLIPDTHTMWKPDPNSGWYKASTIPERLINQLLAGEQIDLTDEQVKKVLAKGAGEQWIIPKEVAAALNEFGERAPVPSDLDKISQKLIGAWKKWTLINPLRIFRYNVNNMSGDMDIAIAYDWRILSYMKKAIADLAGDVNSMGTKLPFNVQKYGSAMTPALKKELEEAHRLDVIGSGFVLHEITNLEQEFAHLTNKNPNVAIKYWQMSKDANSFRENILRLAAFRYFKDRLATGDQNVYGASKKSEIDQIRNQTEKAAKLARELIGDYGNLTKGGDWMRKNLIPFYAWLEINAPRYVRLMRNLKHEGGDTAGLSAAMAWKATKLGLKVTAFGGLVMLWNATMFPDEEEELDRDRRGNMHLILGRRSDGSILYLPLSGAFADALGWFGAGDIKEDVKDVLSGAATVYDKLKEAPIAAATRLFQGTRPLIKLSFEILTGKSTYPDVTKPRAIRDKWEHAANAFSLDTFYRALANKPMKKGFVREITNDFVYSIDPGEAAYFHIRGKVNEFMEEHVGGGSPGDISDKGNALYYYKMALRNSDFKLAQKYLKQYADLGGTAEGIQSSIKLSQPTGSLPQKYRSQFYNTLTKEDQKKLNAASKWYREVYSGR